MGAHGPVGKGPDTPPLHEDRKSAAKIRLQSKILQIRQANLLIPGSVFVKQKKDSPICSFCVL
jgi:hypothetical protein